MWSFFNCRVCFPYCCNSLAIKQLQAINSTTITFVNTLRCFYIAEALCLSSFDYSIVQSSLKKNKALSMSTSGFEQLNKYLRNRSLIEGLYVFSFPLRATCVTYFLSLWFRNCNWINPINIQCFWYGLLCNLLLTRCQQAEKIDLKQMIHSSLIFLFICVDVVVNY